jgi:hypothetical protein
LTVTALLPEAASEFWTSLVFPTTCIERSDGTYKSGPIEFKSNQRFVSELYEVTEYGYHEGSAGRADEGIPRTG